VGIALGPIAGGWLLEQFWWGSIFVALVPVAAVVALLVAWRVPTSRDPRTPPVDLRGLRCRPQGWA
jgi:MFS family permease